MTQPVKIPFRPSATTKPTPAPIVDWKTFPTAPFEFGIPKEAKTKRDVSRMTGLGEEFLNEIISAEEFRTKEYLDSEKNRTIGIGHKVVKADKNKIGKTITNEKVYGTFATDLAVKLKELKVLTGGAKLNAGQKEALVDLSFNVGYGNMENSNLIRKIKAGKIDEAVTELDFTKTGGKVNAGLCRRRLEAVYDYSKENPTKLALKTMLTIKAKGEAVFNRRAKTSGHVGRLQALEDKANYLIECERIIAKHKLLLQKRK